MLTLHHIHKTYPPHTVLHPLTLNVPAGHILTILGESGSGKTTLLHIIAGLIAADSGDIWLNQRALHSLPPEKRNIAMMFQDFALFPHLNVWENVAFGLKMRGIAKNIAKNQAINMLNEVGLSQMAERRISTLSGGQQQRVALARALVVQPELLLLDEPFSSLDTALRQQLQQQTQQFVRQRQIPAILVSHDPNEAALISDHIALLSQGKCLQYGTPAELFAQPNSAAAAKLLGCLNVSEQYYIPPEIINITPNGTPCRMTHCFRQPAHWRIQFQHPQYGELVCHSPTLPHQDVVQIHIPSEKIIFFR